MHCYDVFGGLFESELAFPDLPAGSGREPDWRLTVSRAAPPHSPGELLGEDRVNVLATVRLYRHADGFRLVYDDTGTFDVSSDGRSLCWFPGAAAEEEAARMDVLGRVLPTALHASGLLCLHGSAVAVKEGVIGFLAPKRHGKSTLAQALVLGGATLVTDDVLPLQLGKPALARPGVRNVRLLDDAASRIGGSCSGRRSLGGKNVVPAADLPALHGCGGELRALYLLAPLRADADRPPARRRLLPSVPAAMALLQHARLVALLSKGESIALLDRVTELATSVPVYALELVRDFERLPDVVDRLLAWHAPAQHAPMQEATP